MTKPKTSTIYLIFVLSIIFALWTYFVPYDLVEPYQAKTIKKVSNIYDKPIFLIFNWETEDEIQVGKEVFLEIETIGLPYNNTMTLLPIELFIDERYLNYWNNENDEIMQDPIFKLETWKKNRLTSEKILLRFIVPKDIPIEFCDYNIELSCVTIQDIIHPAPFDLADRIKNSRIMITASLVILSLSSIVVWHRFTEK